MTLTLPLKLPAVEGVKARDKFTEFLGATVMGRIGPANLKPDPETVTLAMVRVFTPLSETERVTVAVLPTCTLPKERLLTEEEI